MTHKQIIKFSNRLTKAAQPDKDSTSFKRGWEAACKYFAHQLRQELRYCEKLNEI